MREEGERPFCLDFEWFNDKKTVGKVRSWIEQRGHKIGKDKSFGWDDGGEASMTAWSVSFTTARREDSSK